MCSKQWTVFYIRSKKPFFFPIRFLTFNRFRFTEILIWFDFPGQFPVSVFEQSYSLNAKSHKPHQERGEKSGEKGVHNGQEKDYN